MLRENSNKSAFLQVGPHFFPWGIRLPRISLDPITHICILRRDKETVRVQIRPEAHPHVLKYLAGVYQGSREFTWDSAWEDHAPKVAPAPAPAKEEEKAAPAPAHKYAIGQEVISQDPSGFQYFGKVAAHVSDQTYSIYYPRMPNLSLDIRKESALTPIKPLAKGDVRVGQEVYFPFGCDQVRARGGNIVAIQGDLNGVIVPAENGKFEFVSLDSLYCYSV